MNGIALAICLGFVVILSVVPGAWEIFQQSVQQTSSIMVCVVILVSIQNYRSEYRSRSLYLLRKHVVSNIIKVDRLQEETEQLLLNILPVHVAKQLKGGIRPEGTMAKKVPNSTILFASISNFSEFLNTVEYEEAMWILNDIICLFDELCDKYSVEKIKSNGPYYMAATGLEAQDSPLTAASNMARFALAMMGTLDRYNAEHKMNFQLKVGINSGSCVSGVIGKKKFSFDIWGDSVNVASRMESTNLPGRIQVTRDTYLLLKDKFNFQLRGFVVVKGKGEMQTYFLEGKLQSLPPSQGSFPSIPLQGGDK